MNEAKAEDIYMRAAEKVFDFLGAHPDWEGTAAALSLKLGTPYYQTLCQMKGMEGDGLLARRSGVFVVAIRPQDWFTPAGDAAAIAALIESKKRDLDALLRAQELLDAHTATARL